MIWVEEHTNTWRAFACTVTWSGARPSLGQLIDSETIEESYINASGSTTFTLWERSLFPRGSC